MTTSKIRWRFALAILSISTTGLVAAGCQPVKSPAGMLPPAYTSNLITDPALVKVAEEIKDWGLKQVGAEQKPRYSRVEVLTPVPIVQPYGVGVFQQEVRLPAIFTTGPGWSGLTPAEKEAAVINEFHHLSSKLKDLKHEPPLQPTLTVQTPLGMELAWLNRVEPNGKNVHGDD